MSPVLDRARIIWNPNNYISGRRCWQVFCQWCVSKQDETKEDRNEVILLSGGFYCAERMTLFFFFRYIIDKTSRHSNNNYCLEIAGERGGEDVIVQKAG